MQIFIWIGTKGTYVYSLPQATVFELRTIKKKFDTSLISRVISIDRHITVE